MKTKRTKRRPSVVGRNIKAARQALGWSLGTLEHHSGVSSSTVRKLESGHTRDPRRANLERLARALCKTEADLRGGRA